MSITPAVPQSGDQNPPVEESTIIRRWLEAAAKTILLLVLGAIFGAVAMLLSIDSHVNLNDDLTRTMGGNAAFLTAQVNKLEAQLRAQREEQARFVTVLLEPNSAEKLVVGALGWLVGIPGIGEALLGGIPGADRKWILKGKQTPMSAAPNTAYAWVNLETKQTEGPFRPEVPK